MKKLINDPLKVADELLEGLVEAYDGDCVKVGTRSIVKTEIPEGKVALLIGGGAGHEPIYHGLVGTNMADGAACGDIFAAPPPDIVLEATSALNKANGVLYLYGNYAGDVMNFDIGAELSAEEGIEVKTVLITDDVCSAPPDSKEQRRGIAGLVLIVKMVGAASQSVQSLDELERIAKMTVLETRSVGVSMSPGSIPATGKPTFEIDEELIGLGMGIHGEPGIKREKLRTANDLVDDLYKRIIDDSKLRANDNVAIMINSLGATPLEELYIISKKVNENLSKSNIQNSKTYVGRYATSMEMAGMSITTLKLNDNLKKYLFAESTCPFWNN